MALVLALCATPAAGAVTTDPAGPPISPSCLPLGAGTTGVLAVGGAIPSPDQLSGRRGGFGPAVSPDRARSLGLPAAVTFKTDSETFSQEYAFALRQGRLYVRAARVGQPVAGEPWHVLQLPACLDGAITSISADHGFLMALGPDRQIYSHDMPGGDLSPERWTWRWGPYFWTGSGLRMFPDVRRWADSSFNSDEWFTDTDGHRHHPIGVATAYLLRGDGYRITYLDPWLPQDQSREVCGPRRSTTPLQNLSASGSTVFVVSDRGELFTRLYDFDVSGANTVFGKYAWQRNRPQTDQRWQLPAPGWVQQPAPPGRISSLISIATTGMDATDRQLRVEGIDGSGRRVVWQKQLLERRWHVVARGGAVSGRLLPLAHPRPLRRAEAIGYVGTVGGRPAVVRDFNTYCSPAHLDVRLAPHRWLSLVLHSLDGMRQSTRAQGLDDVPRNYNGAIEVPAQVWASLQSRPLAAAWVRANLTGRFTSTPLAVTSTRMRFTQQCWQLTRDGRPPRLDHLQLPPDFGIVVGRLTQAQQDNQTPRCLP